MQCLSIMVHLNGAFWEELNEKISGNQSLLFHDFFKDPTYVL